jgi:uncharacterized membrane protein YbhN (UPF0104 family)
VNGGRNTNGNNEMSHDDEIRILKAQVNDLEFRLNTYHESLAAVVKQRDEFALKATWGILHSLAFAVCFYGAFYLFEYKLELTEWYWSLLAFVVGFFAAGLAIFWTEKLADEDQGKLWRLPEWKSKDLYD